MKLGLFFTLGISVRLWERQGLLDREKLIYERLLEQGAVESVTWFTYGVRDAALQSRLRPGIVIVPKPWWLPGRIGNLLYSVLAPSLLGKHLRGLDVIKTNQMRGSWAAVRSARRFRKPLVVRTGFTWSLFAKRRGKFFSLDRFARWFEALAYRSASLAVVASQADADYVATTYGVPPTRLRVIGNYIDTSLFRPQIGARRRDDRLVFVGRLDAQKNLENLIAALEGLDVGLDIYHPRAADRGKLDDLARRIGADVAFKGPVPNRELPSVLNGYSLFVLPSRYEGMPKVLLEAMACGLAVLGTNVVGIRDVVRHGETGFLVPGIGAADLRAGLRTLLADAPLRTRLGAAASEFVRREFSLESTVEREISALRQAACA
jgi:glycosyltransferase involved in cell wall biosynthesis